MEHKLIGGCLDDDVQLGETGWSLVEESVMDKGPGQPVGMCWRERVCEIGWSLVEEEGVRHDERPGQPVGMCWTRRGQGKPRGESDLERGGLVLLQQKLVESPP